MNTDYPLEKRTIEFGKQIIRLCRGIKQDTVTRPLINQLVRSGTSIGANYREANAASSKKDFKNKIHICKKEAQETSYWLELMLDDQSQNTKELEDIMAECDVLCKIFGKIISTINRNAELENRN